VGDLRQVRSVLRSAAVGIALLSGAAAAQKPLEHPVDPLPTMPEPLTMGLLALSAGGIGIGIWLKKRSDRREDRSDG